MDELSPRSKIPRSRMLVFLALLGCLVGGGLRVHWACLLPYNDAPDEFCHYAMARYWSSEGWPPTMADVPTRVPVSYPALPSLGYLPCAITLRCQPRWAEAHVAARLGNVAVGVATIWVAFLAARRLFPASPATSLAIAWATALHPQLIFLDAYVNNDAAMVLVCGILWYVWIRLAESGPRMSLLLALGIGTGVALLTKSNVLAVVLAGSPIVALHVWRAHSNGRILFGRYLFAVAIAGAVCVPWIGWSWRHHRSPWGIDVHRQWWFDHLARNNIHQGFLNLDNVSEFLSMTWQSFWASFGYQSVWLPTLDYLLVTIATGVAIGVWVARAETLPARAGWLDEASWRVTAGTLALGILLAFLLHVSHAVHFGLSPQGRYLMPAFFPILVILCFGWTSLCESPRRQWVGAIAIVLLMGWLEWSALDVENSSNRVRQPDRRCRARLATYAAPFPEPTGWIPNMVEPVGSIPNMVEPVGWIPNMVEPVGSIPNMVEPVGWIPNMVEPVGSTRLASRDGVLALEASDRQITIRTRQVPAEKLGWIYFEETAPGTIDETGSVYLMPDSARDSEEAVPFHRSDKGALSYKVDLRGLAARFAGQPVRVEIRWRLNRASLELRRFEILGRDQQTLTTK